MIALQRKCAYKVLVLSLLIGNTCTDSLASNVTPSLKSCDEIIVSAHPDYAPFHWVEDGQFIGASIDITGSILTSMGVTWRAEYIGPWKRVLQEAYSGDVDLIPALKKTTEREQFLSYTNSHFYNNPIAIYARATSESRKVKGLEDLNGLLGSVNAGDSHGENVDAYLSVQNVMQVRGLSQNFEMLRMGRTDYFVIGKQTAESYLQNEGLKTQFEIVLEIDNAVVHHAFSKRSSCLYLKDEFDRRLKQMVSSGEVENAINTYKERWFNRRLLEE